MLALSIRQPWAWLVAHGLKPVENRTWPTPQRGPVLLHAGLVFDAQGLQHVLATWPALRDSLPQSFDLGGVVGVADLVDCVQQHPSPWFTGPYGHVLQNARPLPLLRMLGKLGYWHVPATPALDALLDTCTPQQAEAAGQDRLF